MDVSNDNSRLSTYVFLEPLVVTWLYAAVSIAASIAIFQSSARDWFRLALPVVLTAASWIWLRKWHEIILIAEVPRFKGSFGQRGDEFMAEMRTKFVRLHGGLPFSELFQGPQGLKGWSIFISARLARSGQILLVVFHSVLMTVGYLELAVGFILTVLAITLTSWLWGQYSLMRALRRWTASHLKAIVEDAELKTQILSSYDLQETQLPDWVEARIKELYMSGVDLETLAIVPKTARG